MSAQKEKLKFKISGSSIAYNGFPDQREKDLMDIMAKMELLESAVVPNFRENITNHEQKTDDDILQLFRAAVQSRLERKMRNKDPAAGVAQSNKITLRVGGKNFSYEGNPAEKQKALIKLLIKQPDLSEDLAIQAFQYNLPDSELSPENFWILVKEAMATKAVKNAVLQEERNEHRNQDPLSSSTKAENINIAHSAVVPQGGANKSMEELGGLSAGERDSINDFIRQVLEQEPMDVAARLREHSVNQDDNLDGISTSYRTTFNSGKIPIYCQENNNSTSKVLHVSPKVTFEEFSTIIEKKFGKKMFLSFYEGEDLIELDDDDVLGMFLEMSQNNPGQKLKLICSHSSTRRKAEDDKLTDATKGIAAIKEKAFSDGTLDVKEVRTFTGHTLAVYCCSLSPNGEQMCTASRDRSVRIWNVNTGSCTVMKGGHNGFVLSCDFSPKGHRVVSSSDDKTIKIWNTSTFSKVCTLKGHDDKVYCVQYNSTGEYIVSGSCDHTVRVWNAESGSKICTLKGHTLAVFSCCFSNSDKGKFVASGSDDRLIKIWNWGNGKEVRTLYGHTGTVWSCRFSNNDNYLISASMDHELKLWDAKTGVCAHSMIGHRTPIHHAVFTSNDKYILSCGRDWTVMVWEAETGKHIETITGHTSTVYHMDIQGNNLVTSSLDNTLKLWTIDETN